MANTVGFTGCPDHLEVWRRNAAKAEADDRFTALFTRCVDALEAVNTLASSERAAGLIEAYALVTGDSYEAAWTLINKARLDRTRVPVAQTEAVPVPS